MTRTCSCLVQQEDNGFTMDAKERRKTKKFTKIALKGNDPDKSIDQADETP